MRRFILLYGVFDGGEYIMISKRNGIKVTFGVLLCFHMPDDHLELT